MARYSADDEYMIERRLDWDDLYCDLCEGVGHTRRTCLARDDHWDNEPTDANGWGD